MGYLRSIQNPYDVYQVVLIESDHVLIFSTQIRDSFFVLKVQSYRYLGILKFYVRQV